MITAPSLPANRRSIGELGSPSRLPAHALEGREARNVGNFQTALLGSLHPALTVEERPFAHRRDLLTRLDLVFMDTTSLYFEGAGGQTLGQRGYSKDHRPDLRQMILAVLIDGDGLPVCSEIWPGNTADVTTLIPVIDRLRRRFAIARVCVVADRGTISTETMAELEARPLL